MLQAAQMALFLQLDMPWLLQEVTVLTGTKAKAEAEAGRAMPSGCVSVLLAELEAWVVAVANEDLVGVQAPLP